jgi:hypothetical protein
MDFGIGTADSWSRPNFEFITELVLENKIEGNCLCLYDVLP